MSVIDAIIAKKLCGGGDGGGGGASSADVLIIHSTTDETYTNAQLDKTVEQIYEAYQSRKYCLVYIDSMFIPVVSVQTVDAQARVSCCGVTFTRSGQGNIIMLDLLTNDGVTWSIEEGPTPLLKNVLLDGLQIYGSDRRLYTISVDADGNITATAVT